MAKLRFIGVGSAFAGPKLGQSNMLIESGEKKLLVDCGCRCQDMLAQAKVSLDQIDAVYITHLHADHVGGMEWMAFCTFFPPNLKRPALFGIDTLLQQLWNNSLSGGLESIQGEDTTLSTFFDVRAIRGNGMFEWEGMKFRPVQTVHVIGGYLIKHSYGLMITSPEDRTTFITGDTQFAPVQLQDFYTKADVIFHDCENGFPTGVHAHFDQLKSLHPDIKKRMWLYHYNTDVIGDEAKPFGNVAEEAGFAGAAHVGQTFEL